MVIVIKAKNLPITTMVKSELREVARFDENSPALKGMLYFYRKKYDKVETSLISSL